MRPERRAWLSLMISAVITALLCAVFQGSIRHYCQSHTRVALLNQAALLAQTDLRKADAAYSKLLKHYSRAEDVLLAAAIYEEKKGRIQQAEAFYKQAVSLGRQRYSAVRRYGVFLDRQSRSPEALTLYTKYLEKYPDDLIAHLDLGTRLLNIGDAVSAIPHLHNASQNTLTATEAKPLLAEAYTRAEQLAEAQTLWMAIAEERTGPSSGSAWQEAAIISELLSDWPKAAQAWERFLYWFPESLKGVHHLSDAYMRAVDEESRRRTELRLAAIQPPIPAEYFATESFNLAGYSPLEKMSTPNHETFYAANLYLNITKDLPPGQEPRLRLVLTHPGGSSTTQIIPEPSRLTPCPFWHGETRHFRIVFSVPADLEPGEYPMQAEFGPRYETSVPLWTFTVDPPTQLPEAP